jgi:hypothetical protein
MTDMILDASILPEPLFKLVNTDKVRVREANGVITMSPVETESGEYDCTAEIFGMYADGKMSVDKFLEQKRIEKALEL